MLEAAIIVFALTAVGLLIQERFSTPVPMTIIAVIIFVEWILGVSLAEITPAEYDHTIIMLLPVLIMADALHLRIIDLKKDAFTLTYLALVSVGLSVAICVGLSQVVLAKFDIPVPALVALFCMLMATDPVAVSAVLSSNKVPHRLKTLLEGESLFNDATALIIFTGALAYLTPDLKEPASMLAGAGMGLLSVIGATAIGAAYGYAGLFLMSMSRNPVIEACVMLCLACSAFLTAEHFHYSGILATIVSTLIANSIILGRIGHDEAVIGNTAEKIMGRKPGRISKMLTRYNHAVIDHQNHQMIIQCAGFLATLALTILFIGMAELIELESLKQYWVEILSVFVMTILVRGVMTEGLALFTGRAPYSSHVPRHWRNVITTSGVKGGISILMLHMLPSDFDYKKLFEAVVVGNVLLSLFVLPLAIKMSIVAKKSLFSAEMDGEDAF